MTKLFTSIVLLISGIAVAAPNPSTTTLTPESAATIAVPAEKVAPAAKKVDVSFVAETYVNASDANHGSLDSFESYNHLGVAYKLSETQKIQYRQYFLYNASDASRTDEWDLGDPAVQYTDSEAFNLGSAKVASYLRLYVPGSEYSREVGKVELRINNSIEQQLARNLAVTYLLNTRLYGYSIDNDSQRSLRLIPDVSVKYSKSDLIKPFVGVYGDHSFRHTGAGRNVYGTTKYNPVNSDDIIMYYGADIDPIKNVSLSIYGETGKDLRDNNDFKFADDDRTVYNLVFSASM